MNDPTADLFDSATDADPAQVELRPRAWKRPEETCGLGSSKAKKRRVDLNPLQRRWFDREGWVYARVEHANAFAGAWQDLWGIADYLAVRAGEIVLVQVTTAHNARARERKIRSAPEWQAWLEAGGKFQIHAWSQPQGPGTRWEMQVREIGTEAEVFPERAPATTRTTRKRG